MRPSTLLACLLIPSTASASWLANEPAPAYTTWSSAELKSWLIAHNIPYPSESTSTTDDLRASVKANWGTASAWTQDQYNAAQQSFASVKDDAFDTWSESDLRSWLLERGVVSPNSKQEELVLLAKHQYNDYQTAAKQWGEWASASASSAATAATETVKEFASTRTDEVQQVLDDSKDYIYSTWDDNRLREYLVSQGVLKTKEQKTRAELLRMMRDTYAAAANPAWNAWSTSYIHQWLAGHNLLPDFQLTTTEKIEAARDNLVAKMSLYYYETSQSVWHTWSDSDLHNWLLENDVITPNIKVGRDKMVTMVEQSYEKSTSTLLSAWSDSHIRSWLVKSGYIDDRSAAAKKRDELVQIVKEQFQAGSTAVTAAFSSATSAPYLSWPDNRLRAYLAENGWTETKLPKERGELLTSVRELFGQDKKLIPAEETLVERVKSVVLPLVGGFQKSALNFWSAITGGEPEPEPETFFQKAAKRVNIEL